MIKNKGKKAKNTPLIIPTRHYTRSKEKHSCIRGTVLLILLLFFITRHGIIRLSENTFCLGHEMRLIFLFRHLLIFCWYKRALTNYPTPGVIRVIPLRRIFPIFLTTGNFSPFGYAIPCAWIARQRISFYVNPGFAYLRVR